MLHSGFVDPEIRAVLPGKRVAGTAVTLRIPNADSTMLHYLTQLVRPGDIVLIDRCGDTRHACWGGVITNTMKMAGVKAGVVDGPATDFSEFTKVDMPMWCRGPSPITTKHPWSGRRDQRSDQRRWPDDQSGRCDPVR